MSDRPSVARQTGPFHDAPVLTLPMINQQLSCVLFLAISSSVYSFEDSTSDMMMLLLLLLLLMM